MKEFDLQFDSCLSDSTRAKETIVLKKPDGSTWEITVRQLTLEEMSGFVVDDQIHFYNSEIIAATIEKWNLKDDEGNDLDVTPENIDKLDAMKKVGKDFVPGVKDRIVEVLKDMSFVKGKDEKN